MQGLLGDFAKVVLTKDDVVLDKHVIDKIDESAALFSKSGPYPSPEAATGPIDVEGPYFPVEFCRAAVYGCVLSLQQGRSGVQFPAVQLMLNMLQFEVIPCFTSVKNIGKELVQCLVGATVPCYYYKMVLASDAAFLSAGLTKVELNVHDVEVLESGHFYFTGIAGLLSVAGTSVLQMIDVVVAMSVEATGTSADAFDVAQYETYRPHRGMITAATRLRQMVDGSQRTGSYEGPISPSFMSIPAVHGPALEYLASATKSILLELHSSDAPPDPRWTNAPEHADPAFKQHKHHSHRQRDVWEGSAPSVHARIAVDLLAMAVRTVLSASLSRAAVLCEMHVQSPSGAEAAAPPAAEGAALKQTHVSQGKVSSDAKALLDELLNAHTLAARATDDDDERLTDLFSSIMRLSHALAIELRISYEVVSSGIPEKDYDKLANKDDDEVTKILQGLLRTNLGKASTPAGGCPMGHGSAGDSSKCPVASGERSLEAGATCPVTGATELSPPPAAASAAPPAPPAEEVAKPAVEQKEAPTGGKPKGKKEAELDDSLTPEQRAKIEAKRRAKEEKAAQKALAKAAKKGGNSIWKHLGQGTTLVRAHLASQLTLSSTFSLRNSVVMLQAYMHPYNISDDGFSAVCAIIMGHIQSSGGRIRPKIAKGARDFGPEEMRIRAQAFDAIRAVFKRHGAVEIDTPVFETKELLTGKYGEDSKLIYDLADQGGELLSLRYDLTVPFARFLAMNSVGNIKRFHIAKVYRRDNPNISKGRFREFYQCDFDIAGSFPPMVADAEVLAVAIEILSNLPIGNFLVKLNHRKLLDGIFEICGVPSEKFRPICSAVDKLDKTPWELVKKEMVEEKGLDPAVADKIGEFVLYNGPPMELWDRLNDLKAFGNHEGALAGMAELQLLFGYLEALGCIQYVSFDLSLARGLDYYTGAIYEAVLTDGVSQVGSIAAGGRYDDLVGMFSVSGQKIPCVGVSIGVERVFAIMEKRAADEGKLAESNVQVYVASIGANMMKHRMRVTKVLWNSNVSAEYSHHESPKFKKQLDEALAKGVPVMVVFGEDEIQNGTVKVKDMQKHTETEVPLEGLVEYLRKNEGRKKFIPAVMRRSITMTFILSQQQYPMVLLVCSMVVLLVSLLIVTTTHSKKKK